MPIFIYLGGHSILTEYRKYCIDNFSKDFNLIDPIAWTDLALQVNDLNVSSDDIKFKRKNVTKDVCKILSNWDKKLIDSCNYLVAYVDYPTFGTVMEIMYSHMKNIPVLAICPTLEYSHDVWLMSHVDHFFKNIDSCFEYIKQNN